MFYGNNKSFVDNEFKKVLMNIVEPELCEKTKKEVEEFMDYFCRKFVTINATALWYETKYKITGEDLKEYREFIEEKLAELDGN